MTVPELITAIDRAITQLDSLSGTDAELDTLDRLGEQLDQLLAQLQAVDLEAARNRTGPARAAIGAAAVRFELHDDAGPAPRDPRLP